MSNASFLGTDLQTPGSFHEGEVALSPWLGDKMKQDREAASWETQKQVMEVEQKAVDSSC